MIAAWLASAVGKIIVFGLAILGLILIPAMVIQTIRLNGISVFGWYAVSGYKPMYEADEKALLDVTTLRANNASLSHGPRYLQCAQCDQHRQGRQRRC